METKEYPRPDYWKTRLDEVDEVMSIVKKGKVSVLTKSAGGRNVYLVEYGEKEDFNRTANYSSSLGAGSEKYYANKYGKKPVVFIIGAEHGDELEGTVAILNTIKMIETGEDFKGDEIPFFAECIKDCRLLFIPIANPDGRSHMAIDTLHGVPNAVFRHYGQGRWKDGSLCMYPACKTIHPIKDAVSFLGAYFNDDGVNIMHDDFFGQMANETKAIIETAKAEAPYFTLNLHGGANTKNEIAHPDYAPRYIKERIQALKYNVRDEAEKHGLSCLVNDIREDDVYPPRTFNLISALYHCSGTTSVLYESNEGLDFSDYRPLDEWEGCFTYEEIILHHYILFEQTIRFAMELAKNETEGEK